jgi:hypothetical protein
LKKFCPTSRLPRTHGDERDAAARADHLRFDLVVFNYLRATSPHAMINLSGLRTNFNVTTDH